MLIVTAPTSSARVELRRRKDQPQRASLRKKQKGQTTNIGAGLTPHISFLDLADEGSGLVSSIDGQPGEKLDFGFLEVIEADGSSLASVV